MALTKLDRANIAKVQYKTGSPGATTRGNICIDTTANTLYFKSGSTWYSAVGGLGGVFEAGVGAYSASRIGTTNTLTGTHTFGMGDSITLPGNYSAAFGPSQNLQSSYSFATGANNYIADAGSTYCAVFGNSQTVSGVSPGNIVAGAYHSVNGLYNAFFGYDNDCTDQYNFYNLVAGRTHTMTSVSDALIVGQNNDVQYSYNATFGKDNENKKHYSIVSGQYTKAIWEGARHFSGVRTDGSTAGSSMGMDGLILTAQTVSASQVVMTLDSLDGSGTNPLYCPDGHCQQYNIHLVGISSGTSTGIIVYNFSILVMRQDPVFNIVLSEGSVSTYVDKRGTTIGTVTVIEDAVNYKAQVKVTGVLGVTSNWTAHITKGIQVMGGYSDAGS